MFESKDEIKKMRHVCFTVVHWRVAMHSYAEVGSWVQGGLEAWNRNTGVFALQTLSLPVWTCFGAAWLSWRLFLVTGCKWSTWDNRIFLWYAEKSFGPIFRARLLRKVGFWTAFSAFLWIFLNLPCSMNHTVLCSTSSWYYFQSCMMSSSEHYSSEMVPARSSRSLRNISSLEVCHNAEVFAGGVQLHYCHQIQREHQKHAASTPDFEWQQRALAIWCRPIEITVNIHYKVWVSIMFLEALWFCLIHWRYNALWNQIWSSGMLKFRSSRGNELSLIYNKYNRNQRWKLPIFSSPHCWWQHLQWFGWILSSQTSE